MGVVFAEAISVRNFPGNSAVFSVIHRGAVISLQFSCIPGSTAMKCCINDLKHIDFNNVCFQTVGLVWCIFLFYMCELEVEKTQQETFWVQMPKSSLNSTELRLVFLFKRLQSFSGMGLYVPNLLQFSVEALKIDTVYGLQDPPSFNISFRHL